MSKLGFLQHNYLKGRKNKATPKPTHKQIPSPSHQNPLQKFQLSLAASYRSLCSVNGFNVNLKDLVFMV